MTTEKLIADFLLSQRDEKLIRYLFGLTMKKIKESGRTANPSQVMSLLLWQIWESEFKKFNLIN